MSHIFKAIGGLLLIAALDLTVAAQNVKENKSSGEKPSASSVRSESSSGEKALNVDQQRALWLLDQLFETAKEFSDDQLKIRVQAQIADALWEYDEARARRQFADAFRAIDLIPLPKPQQIGGAPAVALALNNPQRQLRSEILRLISRRDTQLAEKLIKTVVDVPVSLSPDIVIPGNQSEQASLYLQTALAIVETDPQRAAQLAKSSLSSGVDPMLIPVLQAIKRKNAALADDLFINALSAAQRNSSQPTANIAVLASYVFPNFSGGVRISLGPGRESETEQEQPNPALIHQFLNFAYNAIWQQAQQAQTSATDGQRADPRAAIDYMTIQQLLPFFDQYMPDKAAAIRGRLDEIARSMPVRQIDSLSNINQSNSPEELLSRAETAQTQAQRDSLLMQAALAASRRGEIDQAISIVDKIKNEQVRSSFKSLIHFQATLSAISREDIDTAYRYGKDLPNLQQRAFVFSLMARVLFDKKKDLPHAMEVLNEAEKLIARAEDGPDKARAMLTIAGVVARIDSLRGFEIMRSAVETINHTDFDPQQPGGVTTTIGSRSSGFMITTTFGTNTLNFDEGFPLLAQIDFDRALLLAQSIEKKEASVLAQLAVCRGALRQSREAQPEEKDKAKEPDKDKPLPKRPDN